VPTPVSTHFYYDRLRLKNVRCFRNVEIPLDPHVTVIVGANGSGKTTMMEALASLANGAEEGLPQFPIRRGANTGEIALYGAGRKFPAAKWLSTSDTAPKRRLNVDQILLAYGRYRRVFSPDQDAEPQASPPNPTRLLDQLASHAAERTTVTLSRPDHNLLSDLARYLVALNYGRATDPRLEDIWTQLNKSLPKLDTGLSEIRMEKGGSVAMVVRDGLPLELSELSDGYQALLVVIFDLMLRYAYLFTLLENPLEGEALVGIDEVDLHLHPRWQRNVVSQLTDLFPNTQFVLTTHSPLVVQGAIDQGRTIVTLRQKKGDVVPEKVPTNVMKELRGAEVGSLLVEDHLFEVKSRYSPKYAEVEKRVDTLQAEVSKGTATTEHLDELSKDLTKLEELVAKEDERRADGSTVAQMARLQSAFTKDLIKELKRVKS
jgi:hypothetical protein